MMSVCRGYLDYTPTDERWFTTAYVNRQRLTIGIRCKMTKIAGVIGRCSGSDDGLVQDTGMCKMLPT